MAIKRHVAHIKSNVVDQNGNPKLPKADDLIYGEIAINFAKDKETIAIKNASGEIATFSSDTIRNKLLDAKSDTGHTHHANEVIDMSGYTKASTASAIASGDTLNQAIGKLEKGLDDISSAFTEHTGDTTVHHTHINLDVLNNITSGDVEVWDATPTSGYYDSTNEKIYFKDRNGNTLTSMTIDAHDFIVDGMISSVTLDTKSGTTYLVITWNSDAGITKTELNIGDIFDADNYYNKTTIDDLVSSTTESIAAALVNLNTNKTNQTDFSAHTGDTIIHHTHTNKEKLDAITGNVGTMAYQNTSSYSSKTEIQTALSGKSDTGHTHHANEVIDMSGYTKASSTSPITTADTLNTAIGKLEKGLDDIDLEFLSSVTYSELVTLKNNSELKKGMLYRITDYATTTTQENTQSAGHAFDIIVTADDESTLNENARAIKHSGDTYFSGSNLTAWELKYSLDNDATRFAWADTGATGKGVIYYMKDEHGNECPYDFKNIQFKRFQLKNQNSLHLADYPMGDSEYSAATLTAFNTWKNGLGNAMSVGNVSFYYTKGVYSDGYVVNGAEIYGYSSDYESYDNGNLTFDDGSEGNYVALVSIYDTFDVIAEVANTTGEWFYTFSKKATTASTATDASMDTSCYENVIETYLNSGVQTLNDNIFIVIGNEISAYGNSFGLNCHSNTFGNDCGSNTFGNDCGSNTFGNSCYKNSFGNSFNSNTFGNGCYSNSFGNNCWYNTFGNNCWYNTFGNNCWYNTFGNSFNSNTFGNGCYSNSFGNYFQYNSFGNSCYSNSFGNYFQYNSFGNGCNNITFSKDYCYYNIVEDGNQYITLTSTTTTSSSSLLRNITIAQGVNNTTTMKTISHNTVNDAFNTRYQPTNSNIVDV